MLRSLFTGSGRTRQAPRAVVPHMSVQDLAERIRRHDPSLELLDVRTPREYQFDGHIEGSRLVPLPSLLQRTAELPKDKTIVCICRSGNRSYTACEMLAAQGYDVVNLSGGMIGWRMAGLPNK